MISTLRLKRLSLALVASTALCSAALAEPGKAPLGDHPAISPQVGEPETRASTASEASAKRETFTFEAPLANATSPAVEAAAHEAAPIAVELEPVATELAPAAVETTLDEHDPFLDTFARGLAQVSAIDQADYRIITAFYEARHNKPVWWNGGEPTTAARALAARIAGAQYDGLNPADYILPELASLKGERAPVEAAIRELMLTKAALNHARHLARGRVNPSSLADSIFIELEPFDAVAALESLAAARDIDVAIDKLAPQNPGYLQLKEALATLIDRQQAEGSFEPIPEGRILRPGMSDARVPLLRERLDIAAGETADNRYDASLASAVEAFQAEHGLKVDGIIGPNTLLYLNASTANQAELVALNMERWRWMPRDMGAFHVKVNVPEFTARIFRDGAEIYRTNVIVGQPGHETPIFSDEIEHIIVNPYWHVPYSIASKEILPILQKDPGYLTRNRYEVIYTGGGRPQQVSPAQVDWTQASPKNLPFRFRQVPGAGNALGDVKFMFPNRHSVYLHDTPSRSLFSRTQRALSHGCIRVQNPFEFADVLLSNEPVLTGDRLRALRGDRERTVHLEGHVPVHLMYFTARIDEGGKVRVFGDIYGHDRALAAALEQSHAKPLKIAGEF